MSACKFPGHDAYVCGGVRSDLPPYAVQCPGCGCPSSGHPKTKYAHVWRWYMQTEAAKPYTERDIIELMVRAPACPEWFEPDMSGKPTVFDFVKNPEFEKMMKDYAGLGQDWVNPKAFPPWCHDTGYSQVYAQSRVIQWPRAYAIMVLEAK